MFFSFFVFWGWWLVFFFFLQNYHSVSKKKCILYRFSQKFIPRILTLYINFKWLPRNRKYFCWIWGAERGSRFTNTIDSNGFYTSKNVGRSCRHNWNHIVQFAEESHQSFPPSKWNTEGEGSTQLCSVSWDAAGSSARTEQSCTVLARPPRNDGPCWMPLFNNLGRNHTHVSTDNLILIFDVSILK